MSTKSRTRQIILRAASKEKTEVPPHPQEPDPDLSLDPAEHELSYKIKKIEQQLKEDQDTHNLRLGFAVKIYRLVCSWLILVAIAIFLSGWTIWGFNLSDKVLITFITSTTINVVGLLFVVAKWLFPNNNHNKKDNH